LRRLYIDQPGEVQNETIAALLGEIEVWENQLPDFLKTRSSGSLLHIYARQATVIKLATQHAIIMICRPSLPLSEFGSPEPGIDAASGSSGLLQVHQDRCLEAALSVCEIVTPLVRKESIGSHFWFTAYVTFCAATVMLVYLGNNPSASRRGQVWQAAEQCCEIERKLKARNRLARRYALALEGLFAQVKKRSLTAPDTGFPQQVVTNGRNQQEGVVPNDSNAPEANIHQGFAQSFPAMAQGVPRGWESEENSVPTPGVDFSASLMEYDFHPALDYLMAGSQGNTSLLDLDTFVNGMDFGWPPG
jgi:hypothetical protein